MGEEKANQATLFPMVERRGNALVRGVENAPLEGEGYQIEYRSVPVKSVLSRVQSRRGSPFTYAINPYRGCEFACRYCYARYTHEFLELTPEEFERKIYVKQNLTWLLEQELRPLKAGATIAIGTGTDPYQPIERRERLTRSLLEVFARTQGLKLGIVTKSQLILRDLELLQEISRRHDLTLHFTVTTTDTELARILEPRAPRPDLRLYALEQVRKAKLRAGVLCSPLMPGVTDSRASISAVAKAAAGAGASFFAAAPLFLKPCSLPTFLAFVQEHFPAQLTAYERRYGQTAFVSAEYQKRISEVVRAVRREYRLETRFEDVDGESFAQPDQPWLPF